MRQSSDERVDHARPLTEAVGPERDVLGCPIVSPQGAHEPADNLRSRLEQAQAGLDATGNLSEINPLSCDNRP